MDRSLAGYSPWGHEESDTTEWLSTHKEHIDEKVSHDRILKRRCGPENSILLYLIHRHLNIYDMSDILGKLWDIYRYI